MLQHVFAVRIPILEPAHELDQLRVQALHVGIEQRLLASLADGLVHFPPGLLDSFFDARGVYPPVLNQAVQRYPRDLAPDRIEAGYRHRFRHVVDDQIDARCRFDGSDVPSFTADETTLHLIVRQWNARDGRFDHHIRG